MDVNETVRCLCSPVRTRTVALPDLTEPTLAGRVATLAGADVLSVDEMTVSTVNRSLLTAMTAGERCPRCVRTIVTFGLVEYLTAAERHLTIRAIDEVRGRFPQGVANGHPVPAPAAVNAVKITVKAQVNLGLPDPVAYRIDTAAGTFHLWAPLFDPDHWNQLVTIAAHTGADGLLVLADAPTDWGHAMTAVLSALADPCEPMRFSEDQARSAEGGTDR